MVRAVNGMLKEQTHIFRSFIVSILFFAASTASTFWVIMSKEMAIVCTIIIMISSGFWYVCFLLSFLFVLAGAYFRKLPILLPVLTPTPPLTCSHE